MARNKRRRKTILAVIEKSYRGSLEEQYGHIVWLSRILRKMGCDTGILLKGATVFYGKHSQPQMKLKVSNKEVNHISHFESTLQKMIEEKVEVLAEKESLDWFQIESVDLMDGVKPVDVIDIALLKKKYDLIWYW